MKKVLWVLLVCLLGVVAMGCSAPEEGDLDPANGPTAKRPAPSKPSTP